VSDVIDILEALGADADLVRSPARLDDMLQREGVEPVLRSALLQGDLDTLQTLLRAPDNVCCLINPAEQEEEEGDEEEDEEPDDDDDEDDLELRKRPKPRS
jgi:hypothetical protein